MKIESVIKMKDGTEFRRVQLTEEYRKDEILLVDEYIEVNHLKIRGLHALQLESLSDLNGNVFSAAPDLLQAAKNAHDILDTLLTDYGEGMEFFKKHYERFDFDEEPLCEELIELEKAINKAEGRL